MLINIKNQIDLSMLFLFIFLTEGCVLRPTNNAQSEVRIHTEVLGY